MKFRLPFSVCLMGLAALFGCSDSSKDDASEERLKAMAGGTLKEVVPVKGVVNVDGVPTEGVNIYLFRDGEYTSWVSECRTDKEGKYCWSTNLACDGIEPGKYKLAFTYVPKPKKNDEGVDVFKRRYQNPQRNPFELTVVQGAPQEAANYDLKSK